MLTTSVRAQAPAPQGQLPPLPLTQLDERARATDLDNRAFTLTFAQPVPIRDLLLLLVRGTTLSIVPDPDAAGTFIGELKNVTVRQALGLILPPLGLDYAVDGPFIRVSRREPGTRLFNLNYVATDRTARSVVGGAPDAATGYARVTSTAGSDVFAELGKGVQTLLSDRGTFSIDRKAGLLQVADFSERLDRVAQYLDAVQDRVHRQVQIDASIVEVELTDFRAQSLDWVALARSGGETNTPAGPRPLVNGLRVADVSRFLTALAVQGKVSVLAQPRVLALNNEPAIVHGISAGTGESAGDVEEITLGVTAQVADGIVMLSLSPIVSVKNAAKNVATKKAAGATTIREADTLARVGDGETIVLAGFTRVRESRQGGSGGWFGRSPVVTKKRVELLILLTPRIVS
jgi:MSHA biogenesis protein MshL